MKKITVLLVVLACMAWMTLGFSEVTFATDLNNGLVVYYPFDGNANDESGNGNDGIVNGATLTTDRFGNPDSAFCFDGIDTNGDFGANGVNDYIQTNFMPIYYQGESLTMAAWLKTDGQNDRVGYVIGLERSNHQELNILARSDGHINFGFRDDNWNSSGCETTTTVNDNLWHHIVAVRDTLNDQLIIYVDGVKENAVTDTTTGPMNADSTRWLAIGADNNSTYGIRYPFKGCIDDLRFYNRALSEDEIKKLSGSGSTIFYEGFENNTVGAPPQSWIFNSNWGDIGTIQIVNDPVSKGNNSLKVTGRTNWCQGVYKQNSLLQQNQTVYFDVYLPSGNSTGQAPGYFMYAGVYITFYASSPDKFEARFNHDPNVAISNLSSDRWYTFKINIDWDNSEFRLSCNGVSLPFTSFKKNINGGWGSDISLYGNNSSNNNTVYFDEIIIEDENFNESNNLNRGLVAYYPFNGNADDASGNGNDGNEFGGVAYLEGVVGKAADFNGTSAQIKADGGGDLALTEWTISAWFKSKTYPSYGAPIVGKHQDSYGRYNYGILYRYYSAINSGIITSQYETAGSDADHYLYYGPVGLGEWFHVISKRSADGLHSLYLNGELVEQQQFAADVPVQNGMPLVIGGPLTPHNNFFNGLIDEVRIYNRALSAEEIQILAQNNINTPPVPVATVGDFDVFEIDTINTAPEFQEIVDLLNSEDVGYSASYATTLHQEKSTLLELGNIVEETINDVVSISGNPTEPDYLASVFNLPGADAIPIGKLFYDYYLFQRDHYNSRSEVQVHAAGFTHNDNEFVVPFFLLRTSNLDNEPLDDTEFNLKFETTNPGYKETFKWSFSTNNIGTPDWLESNKAYIFVLKSFVFTGNYNMEDRYTTSEDPTYGIQIENGVRQFNLSLKGNTPWSIDGFDITKENMSWDNYGSGVDENDITSLPLQKKSKNRSMIYITGSLPFAEEIQLEYHPTPMTYSYELYTLWDDDIFKLENLPNSKIEFGGAIKLSVVKDSIFSIIDGFNNHPHNLQVQLFDRVPPTSIDILQDGVAELTPIVSWEILSYGGNSKLDIKELSIESGKSYYLRVKRMPFYWGDLSSNPLKADTNFIYPVGYELELKVTENKK